MLSFNKKYLSIIVTVIFISGVDAEFIVSPSDTEAAVGDNITLYCTSSLGRCEWYHRPVGSHGHEIVFQQGYIYNGYKGRFTVTETNNACNLEIESVSKEDAGLFTCMETSTQAAQKTAELVVFAHFPSDKTCWVIITCAPTCDDLILSCLMLYYGNLDPIMEWSDGYGKQWKTTSTVHLEVSALQPQTFVCQVKYPSKSLSSKYVWSVSIPDPTVTFKIFASVAFLCGSLVTLVSIFTMAYLDAWCKKRKLRKCGDNPDISEKEKVVDEENRSPTEQNCHPDDLVETTAL